MKKLKVLALAALMLLSVTLTACAPKGELVTVMKGKFDAIHEVFDDNKVLVTNGGKQALVNLSNGRRISDKYDSIEHDAVSGTQGTYMFGTNGVQSTVMNPETGKNVGKAKYYALNYAGQGYYTATDPNSPREDLIVSAETGEQIASGVTGAAIDGNVITGLTHDEKDAETPVWSVFGRKGTTKYKDITPGYDDTHYTVIQENNDDAKFVLVNDGKVISNKYDSISKISYTPDAKKDGFVFFRAQKDSKHFLLSVSGDTVAELANSDTASIGFSRINYRYITYTADANKVLYDMTAGKSVADKLSGNPSNYYGAIMINNNPLDRRVEGITFVADGKYSAVNMKGEFIYKDLAKEPTTDGNQKVLFEQNENGKFAISGVDYDSITSVKNAFSGYWFAYNADGKGVLVSDSGTVLSGSDVVTGVTFITFEDGAVAPVYTAQSDDAEAPAKRIYFNGRLSEKYYGISSLSIQIHGSLSYYVKVEMETKTPDEADEYTLYSVLDLNNMTLLSAIGNVDGIMVIGRSPLVGCKDSSLVIQAVTLGRDADGAENNDNVIHFYNVATKKSLKLVSGNETDLKAENFETFLPNGIVSIRFDGGMKYNVYDGITFKKILSNKTDLLALYMSNIFSVGDYNGYVTLYFEIEKGGQFGITDDFKKTIVDPRYDGIEMTTRGAIIGTKGGKVTVMNSAGKRQYKKELRAVQDGIASSSVSVANGNLLRYEQFDTPDSYVLFQYDGKLLFEGVTGDANVDSLRMTKKADVEKDDISIRTSYDKPEYNKAYYKVCVDGKYRLVILSVVVAQR